MNESLLISFSLLISMPSFGVKCISNCYGWLQNHSSAINLVDWYLFEYKYSYLSFLECFVLALYLQWDVWCLEYNDQFMNLKYALVFPCYIIYADEFEIVIVVSVHI